MSRFWNHKTAALSPYTPGEQPKDKKYIKLNTNENPYPPSERVFAAIAEAATADLRLYPDPESVALREAIAGLYGLKTENVFCGNGSDEVLALAFDTFFTPGVPILFPAISYSFYPVYCQNLELDSHSVPLKTDYTIDPADYFTDNGGIVITNPNAPTGIALSLKDIEAILANNPDSLVLVDEAYCDFGAESSVVLIPSYENLLVVQTLSKSRSLAGLRVGFAIGQAPLIEGLNRVKNSFNSYPLDRLAQAGALAAIEDREAMSAATAKIIATRDKTVTALREMGYHVLDSKTNFIMVEHPRYTGEALFGYLRKEGILVRHFKQPGIENYLRITVGTDEEMDTFLRVLVKYREV